MPKLPLRFASGLEASDRRKTKKVSVLGHLINSGCCEGVGSSDSGTTPSRSLPNVGTAPYRQKVHQGRGTGSLAFVSRPRMTQAAISHQTLLQAGMGSSQYHCIFHKYFLSLPNVAVSKAIALICGHRIDKTIYHFLTSSAPEATKRTILQPHSIRRILL